MAALAAADPSPPSPLCGVVIHPCLHLTPLQAVKGLTWTMAVSGVFCVLGVWGSSFRVMTAGGRVGDDVVRVCVCRPRRVATGVVSQSGSAEALADP